ncbi:MAG: hypothetical protein ACKVZJ_07325 [Phycisphaerales bacterium]
MPDPRDIVDIPGVTPPSGMGHAHSKDDATGPVRPFLGIWFKCCHVYGRMYKTADGRRYEGKCPRCAAPVGARVGEGGTGRRFFEAS